MLESSNIESIEPAKPTLTKLPNLKVAHFYDLDTNYEIMTREDLVVVVTCKEQHSSLVQHTDGTHIYSEVWDFSPPDPIEVVVPPEHIYGEWLTSCKDKESIEDNEETSENVNSTSVNEEQKVSIIESKGNKGEENHVEMKSKIVKQPTILKKAVVDGDYEKKQPLRGLLGDLPTKLGVKLSDFAEAQKKHSQTWAPEGYGEAPREIPDLVWPPQPPGHQRERYSTPPPKDDLLFSVEPLVKEPEHSIVWHVRKDGLPKVHGKVN